MGKRIDMQINVETRPRQMIEPQFDISHVADRGVREPRKSLEVQHVFGIANQKPESVRR